MTTIIMLLWLGATSARIWHQARFYQIEEYKNSRYLRWIIAVRERWLPARSGAAWLIGTALTLLLANFISSPLAFISSIATVLLVGWPPREREVKKPLHVTARVKRLLTTAVGLAVLLSICAALLLTTLGDTNLFFMPAALLGFGLWLSTPLLLAIANLLLYPVEAALRQRFINQARQNLNDIQPTVISITGSYGKTSTKNYLAHIMNGRYRTYPTPKSYNTLMGICLAINNGLAQDHSIEYFIAEMGAYVPGEIQEICDLTHPQIAIITEIGPQHLERFGTLENVATAKYEIVKALPPDGVAVFNWDNPYLREMYQRDYPQQRIAISRDIQPDTPAYPAGPRLIATDIEETLEGLRFTVTDRATNTSQTFSTNLLGIHTVTNILLAAAVALHEGQPLRDIAWRVSNLQPTEARLAQQITDTGIKIINDAYSANPVGALSALRVLQLHDHGQRLLITPGMVELGPLMESENYKLGQAAASAATDIILIGAHQTKPIRDGLAAAGFPAHNLHVMDTLQEAIIWYQTNLKSGDTVLFLNDLPDTYTT